MPVRSDITIDWESDPRIAWVDPPSDVDLQDLIDTYRHLEYSPRPGDNIFRHSKLVDSFGKQPLQGDAIAGIILTQRNVRLAFAPNHAHTSNGSATSDDPDGTLLTDITADFISDGVEAGATLTNHDKRSCCTVLRVNGATQLITTPLGGGLAPGWNIGDSYTVCNVMQVSIFGGDLTAVDENGLEISPILPTAGIQPLIAAASSSTLIQAGGIDEILDRVNIIKQIESGRWKIENNQMTFYEEDGATPLLVFDLFDAMGAPSMTGVMERVKVGP